MQYEPYSPIYEPSLRGVGVGNGTASGYGYGSSGYGYTGDYGGYRPDPGSQPPPSYLGQLRPPGAAGNGDAPIIAGDFLYTTALLLGSGIGGGLIGFVASGGSEDGVWRGAITSASMIGMIDGSNYAFRTKEKLAGMMLLLGGLYGMWWSTRPIWARGGRGGYAMAR